MAARARAGVGLAAPGTRGAHGAVATDFAAISRAAHRGEPAALGLLERSARYVAAAARNLADIIDLEVLVLTGSGFAIAGSIHLPSSRSFGGHPSPAPPFWGSFPSSTMLD